MTEIDFWTKSFFAAKKYFRNGEGPTVFDHSGEPFLRDKYNFIEYCALYADACLEEYRAFKERYREGHFLVNKDVSI